MLISAIYHDPTPLALAQDVMQVDEVAAPGSSGLMLKNFVPRFLSRDQLEALSVYNHRL